MKYTYSGSELSGSSPATPSLASGGHRPPARKGGYGWVWVVVLVLLAAGAWFAYRPVMDWIGGTSDKVQPESPSAEEGKLAAGGEKKVTVGQVKSYLTPSDAEMEQLYRYVVNAPFVAENIQYSGRMKDTPFVYVATNDTVNAAAGRRIVKKDGKKGLAFHTMFFGGAARYARLVGLAAALQDAGYKDMLKKFVAAMPRSFCARCPEDDCVKFIAANGLAAAFADEKIRQRAISYSSGTIVSILAHECGHHALGHLLSFPEKANLEIDRNQEREADSFASSVISASPFGEYIFAGTLFWHYALAMQAGGAHDMSSDHPHSQERFENFVRSNSEKAKAMGIILNRQ